jgi:hypothetical protein
VVSRVRSAEVAVVILRLRAALALIQINVKPCNVSHDLLLREVKVSYNDYNLP